MTTIRRRLIQQFHQPRGIPGRLAGWVMAHRGSNRRRNSWVVELLDIQPTDRVLEIGFGPGLAIAEVARRAPHGRVHGIDHSEVMVQVARRRTPAHHVELVHTSVENLPDFGAPLDVVFAVNSAGFWPSPVDRLRDLRSRLRPGGRIALASQPRCPGANRDTTARAAQELQDLLTQAGFVHPQVEILELDPPVACVLATNPTD